MKKLFLFPLLLTLILTQDKWGEPDENPKDNFKFLKKMNLPGYNPTVIVNKPPLSTEYKSNNILPYGVWNKVLEKEKKIADELLFVPSDVKTYNKNNISFIK